MDNNQNQGQNQYGGQPQYQPQSSQPPYNQTINNYNYYQQQPRTSGKAIASMVCGLLSLPMICAYVIPGLILAIVALALAGSASKDGPIKNKGMATTGRVFGIITLVLSIICVIVFVIVMALGLGASFLEYMDY